MRVSSFNILVNHVPTYLGKKTQFFNKVPCCLGLKKVLGETQRPKKFILGAKNAKDILMQLGFSSDRVTTDKKSSSILIY